MSDSFLLRADGITVDFGGLRAVANVGIAIPAGHVVGLIGPNGAGKSTFFNAISGMVEITKGTVHVGQQEVTSLGAHNRARLGIARSFQLGGLVPGLTALENVVLGHDHALRVRGEAVDSTGVERAWVLLQEMGLGDIADTRAASLGSGTRREVEVARCLASGASVTLLDEPGVGLSPTERDQLKSRIRSLADAGLGVLITDHDTDIVFTVSDHVVAMALGEEIAHGPPAHVREDPRVIEAYLGKPS